MSHQNHPFFDGHDPILKAIWTLNRSSTNATEKLAPLKAALANGSADQLISILDEKTGQPRAQVPPLVIGCFEGDYDLIQFLIQNTSNPDQKESEHGITALHVLVDGPYSVQTITSSQRADLVRQLIAKGADVNLLDKHQLAPIHKVAINDRAECLDVLIEAKVDPNVVFMGERALSIAARQNREQVLQKLLNYPATKTDFVSESGGTLLHFASAGMIDSTDCLNLLLKAGLNINAQDQRGNTPAMVACFFNRPRILQTLIAAKADTKLQNKEGKDAATICVDRDVQECAAVLQGQ